MSKLVAWHNRHQAERVSPEVEAAWLHHRFTQIHPFHDGNGRVARALASLVFIQAGLFPLVINRGKMRERYIEALEDADAGNLQPLIRAFSDAQQVRFDLALNISDDLVKPAESVDLAIAALKNRYSAKQEKVVAKQRAVFDLSDSLELVARESLDRLCRKLEPIESYLTVSTAETSHYYRAQVIEAARAYGYYANTTVYRSWVKLIIPGQTVAQLLLSFHGRGSDFAGVMVATPVFELVFPSNEEGVPNDRTQIQVTDRPFEFYYTEKSEEVQPRFIEWLDETVALSLSQLQRHI